MRLLSTCCASSTGAANAVIIITITISSNSCALIRQSPVPGDISSSSSPSPADRSTNRHDSRETQLNSESRNCSQVSSGLPYSGHRKFSKLAEVDATATTPQMTSKDYNEMISCRWCLKFDRRRRWSQFARPRSFAAAWARS